ncbi:hypothetical protein VPNG_09336 [Cytospora leucostoma]|uniref:F-box domain-containing protein n=1 Tax=Cytospora leucostoma TaxID=1230097 RepID=A0A423VSR6_9PEZI|nr:hypothetical protein VPNG_09336 [Cytospora leucostoma]
MLDTLPDDILFIILTHLESAKEIRSLVLANKHLNTLIHTQDEAWRIFVRCRFPGTPLPPQHAASSTSAATATTTQLGWKDLANSLTWQSRAWERRSLSLRAMLPTPTRNQRSTPRRRQAVPFHPVLDAHYDFSTKEELVVWGAGENFVARRRRKGTGTALPEKVAWHRLDGKEMNYVAGYDDIKAVSIVEGVGRDGLGALVGRDNGHLALLDVSEGNFGQRLADFSPLDPAQGVDALDVRWTQGDHQRTVNSIDVLHENRLAAAATKAGVYLYPLPEEPAAHVQPSAYLDTTQHFGTPGSTLGHAKWMNEDTMALALQGCQHQLRFATLTPTGIESLTPYKNAALEDRFDVSYSKGRLCTKSLTPVDASSVTGGHSNLILSAWRDGSVRLQDLRTPSTLDLVYCDNIDPWSEFETLLPFGTSHFVAGGVHGASIKVFDFRWSRDYYHTAGMPCGPDMPCPRPHQPFIPSPANVFKPRRRCDHIAGRHCRWHDLSRDLYYRPNGTFFFSKSLPREHAYAGVWSLARASPLSPNFYIGISGGVVEASLCSTTDGAPEVDPVFGCAAGKQDTGAGYSTMALDASLMETGDGMMCRDNDRSVRMPPMRGKGRSKMKWEEYLKIPSRLRGRHRLDERYHILDDFVEDIDMLTLKEEDRWN